MAHNFGLRIGVEGEKDFKDALKDINRSFKVLGGEMNLIVAAQFDKQDQSREALTARKGVLNKSVDAQKKIKTLEVAWRNGSESFDKTDR